MRGGGGGVGGDGGGEEGEPTASSSVFDRREMHPLLQRGRWKLCGSLPTSGFFSLALAGEAGKKQWAGGGTASSFCCAAASPLASLAGGGGSAVCFKVINYSSFKQSSSSYIT
nr:hypothetical protein [Morchella crassipes]